MLMVRMTRLVLDVLKPHHPDVVEFARTLAAAGEDYRVLLKVVEIDERTQTLDMVIESSSLDLETIRRVITEMGASVHSIDGVEMINAENNRRAASDLS
jgi:hypothetical protein